MLQLHEEEIVVAIIPQSMIGCDWSPFLLDAFGNPVNFNRLIDTKTYENDCGETMYFSDMSTAIVNGYKSSMALDHKRYRGSMVVPLDRLIMEPFLGFKYWPVTICEGDNYRIGDRTKEYEISFREFDIKFRE